MYQRLGRRHPWYATSDEAWEEWFSLLGEFQATFGHLTIDRELVFQSQPLGKWVHNQRINYLRQGLDPSRVERLQRLGLSLDEAGNSQLEHKPQFRASFPFRPMANLHGPPHVPMNQSQRMHHMQKLPTQLQHATQSWMNNPPPQQHRSATGVPPSHQWMNIPPPQQPMNHYQPPQSHAIHLQSSKDIEDLLAEEQKQNQLLSETIRVLQEELQESKKSTRRARSRLSEVSHQTFADHQKKTSTNAREVSKLRAENVALLRKLNEQTNYVEQSESSITKQQLLHEEKFKQQTHETNRLIVENAKLQKLNEKLLQKQKEVEAKQKIHDPPAGARKVDLTNRENTDSSSKELERIKQQLEIKQGTVDQLRQENVFLNEEMDEKNNLLDEMKKENESLLNASVGSKHDPRKVETLEKQILNLENHLKESNTLLASSQESMNEMERQLKERQDDAGKQIVELESRLTEMSFELSRMRDENEKLCEERDHQVTQMKVTEDDFNKKLQHLEHENARLNEQVRGLKEQGKSLPETIQKEKKLLSTGKQPLTNKTVKDMSKENCILKAPMQVEGEEKENTILEEKNLGPNLGPTITIGHFNRHASPFRLKRSIDPSPKQNENKVHGSSSKTIACPESPSVASTECGIELLDKEIELSKVLSPRFADQNGALAIASPTRGTPSTNYKMHAAKLLARRASGILPERRRIFETSCAISPKESSTKEGDPVVSSLILCENGERQFHHPGANVAPPSSVMNNKKRSRIQETAAALLEPNAKRRAEDV